MWAALEVIRLKKERPHIKLVATIPRLRQWAKWNPQDVLLWRRILERCDLVHMVTNGEYTPSCMQRRNMWMVDRSACMIAVYDGSKSGGTYNCLEYAKRQKLHICIIDPKQA